MRITKGVSFNQNDQHEYALFLFAEQQGSFSKYVKRLIGRDMEEKIRREYSLFEDQK
ncbi:hypothetical protein [Metabacillus fastidiosus]|uniref:hypothetical protein n=1 Tax=Metabacillus fastidiosus TaxID=1458 RepID=UPI003D294A11